MGTQSKGRVIVQLAEKGYYEGDGIDGKKIDPNDKELSYDPVTGAIGFFEHDSESGQMVFKSYVKEIAQKILDLETAGVLENARAMVASQQINNFFFDISPNRRIVKLNPELRYSETYRYYAIRTVSVAGGDPAEFLTGRVDGEGAVLSYYVDMDIVPAESGDGNVSQPAVGGLLPDVVLQDKQHYIVEFYDASKTLVNALPFHAVAVKTISLDMTPDAAATHLSITTANTVDGDPNACFLYVNSNFEDLDLMVLLHYSDGTYKNITHELVNGGRLEFIGEEAITTVDPTPDGGDPQTFTIRYYLDGTNADPEQATLSMDLTVNVFVKEDSTADLFKVIPFYWVESAGNSVKAEFFGLYKSGQLNKISHRIEDGYPQPLPSAITPVDGYNQATTARFLYGAEGQNVFTLDYTVKLTEDSGDVGHFFADFTRTGNAGDLEKRTMKYNATEGSFGIITADQVDPLGELRNENTYIDGAEGINDVPTHFRVRDTEGYYFTPGIIPLANYAGFAYTQGSTPVPNKDIPLLVEYLKVENIAGEDVIQRVCYARAYYREVTTDTLLT